jgi:uncharacterized cupin superfamily protein
MANIKISELPALPTLVDTTVFSTVDASTNYKLAVSVLKTYVRGSISLASPATASGGGALGYVPSTGVFTFTPADKTNLVNGSATATLNTDGQLSSKMFLASAGSYGTNGYSFTADGGLDTGMFSSGDGNIQFYSNATKVVEIASGATSLTTVNGALKIVDVRDTVYAATFASTFTPDGANGALQNVTLTGSITINAFANPVAGQTITLILTHGGSGSYTLTSTMKFAGGLKTLSTAVGSVDLLTITYTGSVYYASLVVGFV